MFCYFLAANIKLNTIYRSKYILNIDNSVVDLGYTIS